MFRKTATIFFSLLLCICVIFPVSAQTASVIDGAGLLYSDEIATLEEKTEELKDIYGIQAVILTVDSLNGIRAQDYADTYYDQADYDEDGVLFLLAMAEREWYISTSGSMIYALTDYGIQQIGEGTVAYLANEQWFEGFCYFLEQLPEYIHAFETGNPIDGYADFSGDYYHGDQEEILYYEEEFTPSFLVSLLCGIVVAGIILLVMRLSMNSKRPQRCASVYMKEGSWKLTQHRDLFLYSNVTKTRKQDSPKTSGGTSVHRSSGGRSHGGGGGRF